MKKIIVFILIVIFLPFLSVHGQMLVADMALTALMTYTGIEQAIAYAQMIVDNVQQIQNMVQMVKHMEQQVTRTIQNLASAGDISSWSDFTDWYNRQLYLEKRTMQTFQNMNVSIGNNSYHLTDIEGIVTGYTNQTKDFWDNEFTPEQRKAMWIELGLTPANYAYVETFRSRALELAREGITGRELQNEWYTRQMIRNNERQARMAHDNSLDNDHPDKLTEKEIQMYILESLQETNKSINDLNMQVATMLELQAVDYYLNQTPSEIPHVSSWPERGFGSLTADR